MVFQSLGAPEVPEENRGLVLFELRPFTADCLAGCSSATRIPGRRTGLETISSRARELYLHCKLVGARSWLVGRSS